MNASDLQAVLVRDCIELFLEWAEEGKTDVDTGSHTCSQVGRTGAQVTQFVVVGELDDLLNFFRSTSKSCEDLQNIGAFLHRDNSELILLIDPHQECLVIIVENSPSFRPITVQASGFKESIALLEKEMVLDQLFAILFAHGRQ